MSYEVRLAPAAADDLQRLIEFLADNDVNAAGRARVAIAEALKFLSLFPFSCRKASADNSLLREMIITFGRDGYVALFEIEAANLVTILAVRHQREDDYY
jgi:plasmid stabilization system protein ParE